MKKLGAEFILGSMLLPWLVVLTYGMFNSHEAQAVQETKYQHILEKLDAIEKKLDKMSNEP
jgi:hypothetical protein